MRFLSLELRFDVSDLCRLEQLCNAVSWDENVHVKAIFCMGELECSSAVEQKMRFISVFQ